MSVEYPARSVEFTGKSSMSGNMGDPDKVNNPVTIPNPQNKNQTKPRNIDIKKANVTRNELVSVAIQSIGEIELSMLRTLDELRLCTLGAISRMYYNSPYTARDHVQNLTNLELLSRVQVDSGLVRQSIGYIEPVKNPVLCLGSVGTTFLRKRFDRRGASSQSFSVAPTLSWSHDVAVSEALSYLIAMARASQETDMDGVQHRATAHLFSERRSAVWRDLQFTLDKRGGESIARSSQKLTHTAVVRPDASVLWGFSPTGVVSPYTVDPGTARDPRWTPTRYSWEAAISHKRFGLQYMAEVEQDGEGWYRWWLLELETGSNGAAVMRDKIRRYQLLRALPTRQRLFGAPCPQILVVVRSNSQIEWQSALWRKHCTVVLPGAVLITSLEQLQKVYQMGRTAFLTGKCFIDPLPPKGPRSLSFSDAMTLSTAILA